MKRSDLAEVRRTLWKAADDLRANSTLAPSEARSLRRSTQAVEITERSPRGALRRTSTSWWRASGAVLVFALVAAGCGAGGSSDADGPPSTVSPSGLKARRTTTTTAVVTTTPPTTSTLPPTTVPPTVTLSGSVAFLYRVWFSGFPDEFEGAPGYVPPTAGSPCNAEGGYQDLKPGADVLITDDAGTPVATTELTAPVVVLQVLNTESERFERKRLIDSVFNLRSSLVVNDALGAANVEVARAEQHLADAGRPSSTPFEGYPFAAGWCQLSFRAEDAPVSAQYGVTITHRGTQMFSREAAEAGAINLTVG